MYTTIEESPLEDEPQRPARRRGALCLSIGLFISFSVELLLFTITKLPQRDGNGQIRECGHSVLEAKANGCKFDPTTFAWLPERCQDYELAEEWRNGNFKIYANHFGNVTKTEEEFGNDIGPAYITNMVHKAHCAFAWRMMHRYYRRGQKPHSGLDYLHTKHCSKIIVSKGDDLVIATRAIVGFPAC